jgi:DNA-binding CsgD family transcriptional regulator
VSTKRPSIAAPAKLVVERLTEGGEELAIFSWEPKSAVASGLSPSEREVLDLVARGASNAEIARERSTSVRTIANQVASILRKTGCSSRFDLIRRFAGAR